eukprot:4469762-Pyramimonas_sp.AAC.1
MTAPHTDRPSGYRCSHFPSVVAVLVQLCGREMSSDAAAGRERERCLDADSLFQALSPFANEREWISCG